jgi:uncharacterized protein with HEPN domain
MPSDRIAKCFHDMLNAIGLIESWVNESGGASETVFHDMKARSAIERQLLVISEAASRLYKIDPSAAPRLAPAIDWPGIRGIGNFIRHRYDDLDSNVLVDVLRNRLIELRLACQRALQILKAS